MISMRSLSIIGGLALTAILSATLPSPAVGQSGPPPLDSVLFQTWGADSLRFYVQHYPRPESDLPVALMLHDRGAGSAGFEKLALTLGGFGMPIFLPDMRGEGSSVLASDGRRVFPAERWTAAHSSLMVKDLASLLRFADNQSTLRGRPWIILCEGEAVGMALELMKADSRFVGAVLLSPTPAESVDPSLLGEGAPLLLLACDQDVEAVAGLRALYAELPKERRRMELLPCRSRGVRMLDWVPGLVDQVTAWCLEKGAD